MRSSFSNLTRLAACWACLTLSPLALAQPPADTAPQAVRPARASLLIQSSPLAGSQYHALADVVNQIRIGDALTLRRVPDNPHDRNAIEVLWQGHILGFVPRRENSAVARAMDRGEPLEARISALRPDETPWRRLRFEISMPLDATATAQDSGSKPAR